ncbi:MAG TPA: lipopolysaccharide biosynthesis protein [Burkholderiales bacterium]|nr:lipopolysaccharide biosynthesis protein [Burkholderiales bacterium]
MSAGLGVGAGVAPAHGLGRRALSLGVANAFDYALQFLLPVVLVRCLDAAAFGQYRLLWLAAGTAMAVVTMAMPGSLYYFLPRSEGAAKRLYINQALVFLAAAGLIAAWAASSWNPWLPEKMRDLAQHDPIVPLFVLLWMVASLLDLLPMVEERVIWQAKAIVGLAALRTVALSLAALVTRELEPVLLVLLAFVAFKVALLLGYMAHYHGLRGPLLRRGALSDQLRYAAPIGAAGALYGLRLQADQWVAAALFSVGSFASFSIAAVLGPLVHLCRHSVFHASLPSVSRLQAAGDIRGMLDLKSRANVMVGALVFPLLAFAFVYAEEMVTIIYTATYVDAAPVMRVSIAGYAALVVELTSILQLLRQGAFAMRVGLIALVLSVALSWFSAHHFGLAGAAAGSVTAIYFDLIATLRRVSLRTGIPLRRLQDWRALGLLTLLAALAAVFAWGVTSLYFAASGPLVRLIAGGTFLATAYVAMGALSGMGRDWLAALRKPERGF